MKETSQYMELAKSGKLHISYHVHNISLDISIKGRIGVIGGLGLAFFAFGVTNGNIYLTAILIGIYLMFWSMSLAGEVRASGSKKEENS